MSKTRQGRIEEAFHNALALPPGQRDSFVREALADDPAAIDEVLELLAMESGDSMIVERILNSPRSVAADQLGDMPRQVGVYLIEKEITRGGMGRVFLGRRADDEYENQVAIKMVRVDRESEWAETRFREERQILARLVHPNIATLLDGGTTEQGQPYVVMQFIDGKPVDEYCDNESLSLEQVLRLFQKICSAVSHAHRNLVIHRDIKPANVLVAEDGEPRLLDFGIAKIISEGQSTKNTVTRMGVMTLAYASPEQVRGEPVTTATDIYSLGVLLYELLTGETPLGSAKLAPSEMIKAICDTQAVLPSDVSERPQFARSLRGDLDNIVLKALRKTPDRRYGSVDELSADIDNYLEGKPVTARGNSALYRTGKFLRRHALGVSMTAVFFLLLGGMTTFYTIQVSNERDRAVLAELAATEAAEIARNEATTAQSVSEFLTGLFEAVDPRAGVAGKDLTARDLLDLGAESLDTTLEEEPRTRAHMWRTIGLAYAHMGEFDRGIASLRRSLELHREHSSPLEIGEATNRLAEILRRSDHFEEAVVLHREAIQIHEEQQIEPTWELADSYNNFGLLLYQTAHYDESLETLNKAVSTHRAAAGGEHPSIAINMHNITQVLRARAEFEAAEEMIRQSLEITGRLRGNDSAPYIVSMQQWGRILNDLGRYEEALDVLNLTVEKSATVYEPDNPRMAAIWNRMANTYQAMGDYEQAEQLYLRAIEINAASHGPDSWNLAYVELEYAQLLRQLGRLDEAESLLRHSLAVRERLFGPDNPNTALAQAELGSVLSLRGFPEEGLALITSARTHLEESLGEHHPDFAWVKVLQAQSLRLADLPKEARPVLDRGVVILQNRLPEYPARVVLAASEQRQLARTLNDCEYARQAVLNANSALALVVNHHPLNQDVGALPDCENATTL